MAEEELTFGVTLEDHMSGPAHEAAKGLGELAKGAEHGKGLLDELTKGFIKTVEPAEVLKDAFKDLRAGISEFAEGLRSGEAKGMIAGVTEAAAGLAQVLDLVAPGLGQVAAAVIRFSGGAAGALAGLIQSGAELAIEASHMKASLIDTFAALGGGEEIGRQTEEMLSALSHQIGVTRNELAPFAKSFMAMGITGEEALRKVTLAAASAQAIMQDPGAAHAFENLTKKIQVAVQTGHGLKITAKGLGSLADMGIRVDDVAKRMNVSASILAAQLKAGTVNAQRFGDALQDALIDKGAKPLQRMAGSMGNLKKLMGQNIEEMFDDLGKAAEPFLDKLRQALSLFDQSTESGRTMKSAVTAAFTQIFAWATKAVVPVEHFFLRTIIMGVKTYTLIKKHWTEIRALFIGVEPAISAVAHAFEQIEHAINVIAKLDQKMTNMLSGIGQMSRPIGKNFSDGVADGIADGTPGIKDAAKGSAMVAVDGAKAGLDAHSPSRKTFAIGQFASGGLAMGMRSRGPEVAAAGRSVAGITLRSMATSPGRQMGQSGASVGAIHLTIQAPQGVTNAEQLTEIGVATIFERLQLMVAR